MTCQCFHILEKGGNVVGVFMDLAKAFDGVPHVRIRYCLQEVGVGSPVSRLSVYKTSQFVAVEGCKDHLQVKLTLHQVSCRAPSMVHFFSC